MPENHGFRPKTRLFRAQIDLSFTGQYLFTSKAKVPLSAHGPGCPVCLFRALMLKQTGLPLHSERSRRDPKLVFKTLGKVRVIGKPNRQGNVDN